MLPHLTQRSQSFRRMKSEVQRCARNLAREVGEHQVESGQGTKSAVALDLVEKISSRIEPDNAVEAKRFLRHNVWAARVALEEESPGPVALEVREALEDVRNTALDISWTKNMRKYPTGEWTVRPQPSASDIPNFEWVNENFLRGGQPDQGGMNWLKEQGVKTVLDLRGGDRDNSWVDVDARGLNVKTIDIPDFEPPTYDQVQEALNILNDPENHPVFVHCKAGVGRTGTITACWNVDRGLTAEEALKKERINSYYGSLRQEDFVRDFERLLKNPEMEEPRKAGPVSKADERKGEELWPLIHAYSDVTLGTEPQEAISLRRLNREDSASLLDFDAFWKRAI